MERISAKEKKSKSLLTLKRFMVLQEIAQKRHPVKNPLADISNNNNLKLDLKATYNLKRNSHIEESNLGKLYYIGG